MINIKIFFLHTLLWLGTVLYIPFYFIVLVIIRWLFMPLCVITDELHLRLIKTYDKHPMWYNSKIKNILSKYLI